MSNVLNKQEELKLMLIFRLHVCRNVTRWLNVNASSKKTSIQIYIYTVKNTHFYFWIIPIIDYYTSAVHYEYVIIYITSVHHNRVIMCTVYQWRQSWRMITFLALIKDFRSYPTFLSLSSAVQLPGVLLWMCEREKVRYRKRKEATRFTLRHMAVYVVAAQQVWHVNSSFTSVMQHWIVLIELNHK